MRCTDELWMSGLYGCVCDGVDCMDVCAMAWPASMCARVGVDCLFVRVKCGLYGWAREVLAVRMRV